MRWPRYYAYLISCFLPFAVTAQAIDNTLATRALPGDRYWRINYENDFFSASDRDYTQGLYVEHISPKLKGFPLTKLLWHPANSTARYGLALEQDCYTPNYIDQAAVQYGDRPYAGALFLKTFVMATNEARKERISTQLSTGIIGPAAGGEAMQRTIHQWINYTKPLGWHNQVKTDIVLNYQLNYERELYAYRHLLAVSSVGSVRLGSLSTKATAGLTLMAGHFTSPFNNTSPPAGRFQWYSYFQPLVTLVRYDATLQGGLFHRSSVYTIRASDINRFTAQYRAGIVLVFKRLSLEYYRTGITREFSSSIYHRTGGLQVGFGF
jgi:lipid A 3-O-deacylase